MTGEALPEGWGMLRPGDRGEHYYRNGMSLCGRVGFYEGPMADDNAQPPGPDDCKACRKKLMAEQKRIAKGSK